MPKYCLHLSLVILLASIMLSVMASPSTYAADWPEDDPAASQRSFLVTSQSMDPIDLSFENFENTCNIPCFQQSLDTDPDLLLAAKTTTNLNKQCSPANKHQSSFVGDWEVSIHKKDLTSSSLPSIVTLAADGTLTNERGKSGHWCTHNLPNLDSSFSATPSSGIPVELDLPDGNICIGSYENQNLSGHIVNQQDITCSAYQKK